MKKLLILTSFALMSLLGFSSCAVYTLDDYCGGSYYQSHYYHRPTVHHHHRPVVHHHSSHYHHRPTVHHHHGSRPTVHHHHRPTVHNHHPSKPSPRPSIQSRPHNPKPAPNPRQRNDSNHHRRDSRK